jgi:hypothetical protein
MAELDVRLTDAQVDALLAVAEWALDHPDLNLGPDLRYGDAFDGAKRMEAVADLHRRGVDTDGTAGERA